MAGRKRKQHKVVFNAKVVLEVAEGDKIVG
jgi:hypothetical protein